MNSKRKTNNYRFRSKKVRTSKVNLSPLIFNQHKRQLFNYKELYDESANIMKRVFNANIVCVCEHCAQYDSITTITTESNELLYYSDNFDLTIFFDHSHVEAVSAFVFYLKQNIFSGIDKIPPHIRYPILFKEAWFDLSVRERIMYTNRCSEEKSEKLIYMDFIGSTFSKLKNWFENGIEKIYFTSCSNLLRQLRRNLCQNNTVYELEYGAIINLLAVQVKYNFFKSYTPLVEFSLRSLIVLNYIRNKKIFSLEEMILLANNIFDLKLF